MSDKAQKRFRYSSQAWLGKSSAGFFLGFLLALSITGVLLRYGFGEVAIFSVQGQFLMWMIAPIWLAIISTSFLFRSSLNAWLYLGLANATCWLLVFAEQLLT